jgi:muramoyltetrapeptide carboxypeptidase
VPGLIRRSGPEGVIFYFENAEMRPTEFARALASLRMNGWFDALTGVLVGRSTALDAGNPDELSYRDVLDTHLGDVGCPVLWDVDLGHRPPQLTLINGAIAEVHSARGTGVVTQLFR